MPIKVGLISLGCAKNLVDSEHMLSRLKQAGMELTEDIAKADVAVINTCGFIEGAKQEAIETILETAKYKTEGRLRGLVATGCLTQRYREEFGKELPEVDAILGTGSYEDIVDAVLAAYGGKKYQSFQPVDGAALEGGRELMTPGYTAFLKIAEGCDNRCAYCVIPKLRGRFRSRRMEDILKEAEGLAEKGVKEIIVVAQDITRYGIDLYKERRLGELISKICALPFTWVRLHYLYPDEITDDLLDVIAREDKIVKYLDIPIQHVNDRILKAMHRRGGSGYLTELFAKIRARIPAAVLRTSLIVGLPGETEEEFTELCSFLQKNRLERVGVFQFSPEEGSEAAEMPDQVSDEMKSRRQFIIEQIQSNVLDDYNLSRKHQVMTVLCEGYDGEAERYIGRTYADSPDIDGRVLFYSDKEIAPGEFAEVRIEDSEGPDLLGSAQ